MTDRPLQPEDLEVATVTVKSIIKIRWRTRLKIWWQRRRMTPEQRQIADDITALEEARFLFGHEGGMLHTEGEVDS